MGDRMRSCNVRMWVARSFGNAFGSPESINHHRLVLTQTSSNIIIIQGAWVFDQLVCPSFHLIKQIYSTVSLEALKSAISIQCNTSGLAFSKTQRQRSQITLEVDLLQIVMTFFFWLDDSWWLHCGPDF